MAQPRARNALEKSTIEGRRKSVSYYSVCTLCIRGNAHLRLCSPTVLGLGTLALASFFFIVVFSTFQMKSLLPAVAGVSGKEALADALCLYEFPRDRCKQHFVIDGFAPICGEVT